jgi:hypothetical protein
MMKCLLKKQILKEKPEELTQNMMKINFKATQLPLENEESLR